MTPPSLLGGGRKRRPSKKRKQPERSQLNIIIDANIIADIKELAAHFDTRMWVVSEHLIQIGSFFMKQVMKDPDQFAKLRLHLVKSHYLEPGPRDTEAMLRLGEPGFSPEVFELSQQVIRHFNNLRKLVAGVKHATARYESALECQRVLVEAALMLAEQVVNHPLETPPPSEGRRMARILRSYPRKRGGTTRGHPGRG